MEQLAAHCKQADMLEDTCARFLTQLALLRNEHHRDQVRKDIHVQGLIQLQTGQNSAAAAALHNVFAHIGAGGASLSGAAVDSWPGGRHSNDATDFRAINAVPVAAEVQIAAKPFLPKADGSDQFLQAQVRSTPQNMLYMMPAQSVHGVVCHVASS
jgi:hypothetical protein